MVVDTFIDVYADIAPAARLAGEHARSLTTAVGVSDDSATPLRDIRANAAQTAAIAEFGRELERTHTLRDMVDVTFQYVRQLTPATVFAVYRHVQDNDNLTCIAAAGDPEHLLSGLTMKNGERISGWSAANEKTIANSQASLDLNAIADLFVPPLRSALATPLKSGHRVVGAVTAYATREEPFTDDHRYAFERLASSFADHFQITISAGVNSNAVLRFPMADTR